MFQNRHKTIYLPLPARRRNRPVEHELKILKREFNHIIGKLTYLNNFVFADPHKKEAHAHCTHLQIAQANPQTEICKRVQYCLAHSHIKTYDNC